MTHAWLWLMQGAAAEAPHPPSEVVDLSTEEDLPSALDSDPSRDPSGARSSGGLTRGRFSARPVASVSWLAADRTYWATRMGAAITHRWWSLRPTGPSPTGDTELLLLFPVGAAHGRRVTLTSLWGAWLGPVGLRAGPTARWDRTRWRNADITLDDSLAIGGRAVMSLELGPLRPMVGIEPAWLVLGSRGAASQATSTLPVWGQETGYMAGLGWVGDRVAVSARCDWRETVAGSEVDGVLSLAIRLF